ncbi:serrate RNA effector molecule homolog isoform X1 [Sycon ciliatum]|uniref:serrate RNA effector molecule homolog isoform X1 n=2 Tax=Sycon ciliatum TaxID=27933 RepID=UPI0031F643FC
MMGDSDEEHDTRGARRGRDKFRRERSDFSGERQGRRDGWGGRRPPTDGGREMGNQQGQWDRRKRDYADRRGGGGDRPGPRGDSPPMKRRRRDWDVGGFGGDFPAGPYGMGGGGQWGGPEMGGMGPDRRGSTGGGAGGGMQGGPGMGMGMMGAGGGGGAAGGGGMAAGGEEDEPQFHQPMLTFKQWLADQSDDVGEEEVVERYNTYKLDFKRTTINKFFDAHKDEEWFREKYHPVIKKDRDTTVRQQLRTRVNAFVDLMDSGRLDKIGLDAENMDGIVRLLDAAMIKMEGGTDNDLRILDRPPTPPRERKKSKSSPSRSPDRKKSIKKAEGKPKAGATVDPPSPSSVPLPSDPPPQKESVDANAAAAAVSAQEAAEKAAKEKQREEFLKKQEAFQQQQIAQMAEQMAAEQAKAKKEKRKHRRHHRDAYSYDTDESETEEDSDEDDEADEPAPPGVEPAPPGMETAEDSAAANGDGDNDASADSEPAVPGVTDAAAAPAIGDTPVEPAQRDDETTQASDEVPPGTENTTSFEQAAAAPSDATTSSAAAAAGESASGDEGMCDAEDGEDAEDEENHGGDNSQSGDEAMEDLPEPRPLHQTRSLHIRNLPPSVTRAELIAIGKKTPGFLRAALGEPSPEKKFQRRAWLTYKKDVNINEAHWSINTMKLKDHELNVITNRDVTNRVRNVSHLSLSRQAVAADIRLATRLIRHLDSKYSVYELEPEPETKTSTEESSEAATTESEEEPAETKVPVVKLCISSNPLLSTDSGDGRVEGGVTSSTSSTNMSSSLSSSSSAPATTSTTSDGETAASDDEDGTVKEEKSTGPVVNTGGMFKRDDKQLRLLDRLLLYLRLVHSVDFYQTSAVSDEHDMPHRCCVIHVRGPVVQTFKASLKDVTEYIKAHEDSMAVLLKTRGEVSSDEARQLGLKSIDTAVEAFVDDNCKEVSKDKFLCPLSGKKFRGPEFVRKHIFNKHGDAVQVVRDDVTFFNSFLRDPDRPHIPLASASSGGAGNGGSSLPVRARLGRAGPGGPMPGGPGGHPGMQGGPNPGFEYPPEGMYGPGPGFMGGWGGPRPHVMGYNPPFMPGMFNPFGGPPMEMFGRPPFPPGGPRGRGRRDRRLMDYRDLDQPEDVDF